MRGRFVAYIHLDELLPVAREQFRPERSYRTQRRLGRPEFLCCTREVSVPIEGEQVSQLVEIELHAPKYQSIQGNALDPLATTR
jgi:hypothetical protein